MLERACLPVPFTPPCQDHALSPRDITLRCSKQLRSHSHLSTSSYICPQPFRSLGSQWDAAQANWSLADHVTMRSGPCLWSTHLGVSLNAIFSHQSNQPPPPGTILTRWAVRWQVHYTRLQSCSPSSFTSFQYVTVASDNIYNHTP